MGVTGSNAGTAMSASLPELIARIRNFTPVPLAVGFGVDKRTHFDFVTSAGADGVVIGSKVIKVVEEGFAAGDAPKALEEYVRTISLKGQEVRPLNRAKQATAPSTLPVVPGPITTTESVSSNKLPDRFGIFGGAYVPEALVDCLSELEAEYIKAKNDPAFWKEYEDMFGYMNRPSELYLAERLTEQMGGAKIWLKREDLNHTGSHKINNAVGQVSFTRTS